MCRTERVQRLAMRTVPDEGVNSYLKRIQEVGVYPVEHGRDLLQTLRFAKGPIGIEANSLFGFASTFETGGHGLRHRAGMVNLTLHEPRYFALEQTVRDHRLRHVIKTLRMVSTHVLEYSIPGYGKI